MSDSSYGIHLELSKYPHELLVVLSGVLAVLVLLNCVTWLCYKERFLSFRVRRARARFEAVASNAGASRELRRCLCVHLRRTYEYCCVCGVCGGDRSTCLVAERRL